MKKYFILAILSFVFLYVSLARAGFGISPPYVKNDYLLPGTSYTQEITVSRSEADQEWKINIKPELPDEIAPWFTYEFEGKNMIPKSQQFAILKIKVDVPKDAEQKEYRGAIRLVGGPSKNAKFSGTGAKIALGAKIDVALKVLSEEKKDLQVNSIGILDTKTNEPLVAAITAQNNGNIYDGLNKVKLEIFDSKKITTVDTLESEIKEEIMPQETRELKIEFPNKYKSGKYLANLKIYYGDKIIKEQEATFQIKGMRGEMKGAIGFAKKYVYILIGIGGIFTFLASFCFYFLYKKRAKKPLA